MTNPGFKWFPVNYDFFRKTKLSVATSFLFFVFYLFFHLFPSSFAMDLRHQSSAMCVIMCHHGLLQLTKNTFEACDENPGDKIISLYQSELNRRHQSAF